MRGIYEVVGFLLCFCLIRRTNAQGTIVRVPLEEGKKAGHTVHSLPLPASNEIYTFFSAAQDADSRAALTLFQISQRGVIKTTKPITYEIGKKNYYDLVAIRRNRGDKEGGIPTSIRITITDTNNFSPTFPQNLYHGRVKEGSSVDTVVIGLENCFAEDRDSGGVQSYSIASGNENNYFKTETNTVNNRKFLVLKTTNVPIVMDTTPEINLTVLAKDGVSSGTTKITIEIIDVNNNAPVFEKNSYSATVNEDAPLLTSVLRVRATDKDLGTNGGIYYNINGGQYFAVDAITGVIKVVRQLPNQPQVLLKVVAKDRGTPSKTITVQVTININLIDDYPPPDDPNPGVNTPPVFPEESYSASVREDFPIDAALLVVHAVDRDPPGRNRRITYSLSGDSTNTFQIDQSSGVVKLRAALDYDKVNQYNLNVIATDQGVNRQTATAPLTITVQEVDKNRHAPVFQPPNTQQLSATVKENMAVNTPITFRNSGSISAVDADGNQSPDGQVVYSIFSGSGLPYFSINKDTARVTTYTKLDREKQAQFDLVVEARDEALYPRHSHLYLMIDVTADEDNNPDFSQAVYHANVPEGAPANTFVTVIHATDKDGVSVSYSITNAGSAFTIQSNTGVITTARKIDPTTGDIDFTLFVNAKAGSRRSEAQVNVTIVSKQDSPPTFKNAPYTVTVPENLGPVDNLLCVAAYDVHRRPVSYSIASAAVGKFKVDPESGEFAATGSFDYELVSGGEYLVQVQASSGPQQVATAGVTVKVTDDRDPPNFSKDNYRFEINENIPSGTTIQERKADGSSDGLVINDEDTGILLFECTIENVQRDVADYFRVVNPDNNNKECRLVTQKNFNHFKTPKFTFEVRATDKNYRNMYASAMVEVIIKDTNDHNPVFSQLSYWASVSSNFPVRNSILKVSATDEDSGSFGEITYELLDSEDRNRFSLDSNSGVLSSANSLAVKKYQLKVRASDRAQNENEIKRSIVDVSVTVYSPGTTFIVFDPASYSRTVTEDANQNTAVFTASARGPSGIQYSIVGGNTDNAFGINQNSGQVFVNGPLDREAKETYNLIIRAVESSLAAEAPATVRIGDVNDNSPRITFLETEPKNVAIEDYSPAGSYVIKVIATDPDVGAAGTVKYSITTPNTPFQINENTGVITAKQEIRKSQQQTWDITVKATDGASPPRQSPGYQLRIHVTDGLQAPQLRSSFTATIDEDEQVGYTVQDISPQQKSSNYKYSIQSGNTDKAFCINHAGIISVARPLDREKISSYSLKVSASVGSKVSNSTVTVIISDRNDDTPKFTKTVYSFDVSEDKRINQEVGKVSATDRDTGTNGEVEYRLLYTVDVNSKFNVNSRTGSITTVEALDFEQIPENILYIRAADKGRPVRSSIAKVTLNVKDVNDWSPKFSADSYVTKVSLDEIIGAQVLLVTATDLDSGDNGRIVYNITSGNQEDAFKIDPDTGAIKVKKSLTTVSASRFSLEVEAKDKGNPPRRSTTTVQFNVFLPDGPPKFVVKPVIQEVTEGVTANGRVMVVKAATSEALTYEIVSGNEDGLFRIVPSTGELKVTRVLDYEDSQEHRLVVRVMDTRDRSDQVTVIIKVKNVNDNEPKFPGEFNGFLERKVEEDFQVGDAAARLLAYDRDPGDTISYTLSDEAKPMFSIDSNGFLIAKRSRSQIKSPGTFYLTAKDSGTPPRETKVQVQLTFVTYRADQQPVRVYVREDKEVGSVIAIVPRYFPGGTLSIIFPQKSNFTLDNSGKIRMRAPFDFEQTQFYSLTVREEEPPPGGRTNDVDVEINVVDINDNKPKFTMVDFFGRVNTNSRPGTSAYQLKAEDKDGGLAGRVGYQLVSKSVPFGINPRDEVVETDATLRDLGGYNVTLFPFDFGIPRQVGRAVSLDIKTVTLKPQFSESAYKFKVFERDPPGVIVGVVNATSLSGARLGYSITQGDPGNNFQVHATGEIKLNSLLDREKRAMYNLKVKATELIPKGYSNDVEVQITVTNANEHYPSFTRKVYEQSVDEDVSSGTVVLSVSARDNDCGTPDGTCQLGLLKYSLEGTSLFTIDPITGVISVGPTPLDYETKTEHVFTAIVEDFGEKKQFKSKAFVKLTVRNKNDEVPQFQQSDYTIGIAEDAETGKALAAILARDADGSSVIYSITSGNTNIFQINSSTGVLSLRQSVKGLSQTQYSLQVRARDSQSARHDEVRVVVNIEDGNDIRPVFIDCPKEVSVEENRPSGQLVYQVTAVDDKDRGRNREVEYFLTTSGERLFEIDNTTGVIRTLSSLDRENKDQHNLIVMAEDGGHGRNEAERLLSYCIMDVKVEDMNDNHPVFLTRKYFASVWQGANTNTNVLTVSAADADTRVSNTVDNSEVVYQLVTSDDKFRVEEATGIIRTKVSLANYQGTVQLQIRALNKQPMAISDQRPRESTTTVEINVAEKKPPVFTSPVYKSSINEDVKPGTSVGTIKANSQVNPSNKILYSLVKSNPEGEQKFKIDPTIGEISTASTLDYEQKKEYKLQFRATESQTNLYTTCLVIIGLVDVNDDTPTFKLEEYKARVPENAAAGFNVITIEADDRDTGASGEVVYSLEQSDPSVTPDFTIELNSGIMKTTREFDREASALGTKYNVVAKSQDKGSSPLSAKVTVTVAIVDQNDMPPVFAQRRYEANVEEDATIGTSIRELSATDGDIGDNAKLDYFVSSGDASQNFKMVTVYGVRNYGILMLDRKLDYETKTTYTITVTATDRKDSDTVEVVINVIDTNDNAPQFTELIYEARVPENSDPGRNVVKVTATDLDSSKIQSALRYSLDAAGQRYFSIDATNAQIRTANERLDRETNEIVTFFVYAFDGKHRGQALVRVTLDDVNDNSPYFPNPPYVGYVEENQNPGASVMVLQAFDLDIGSNAKIVYTLEDSANDKFTIDRDSGLVTTRETLDRESTPNEFTIKVQATDQGNPALSGTVTATIKVADGNDQSPVFNPTVYVATVKEDDPPGSSVTLVQAKDADEGPNAELEYTITKGNDPYQFYINPRTGAILVSGLLDFDHGKKWYNLTVNVSDRGNPPNQAEKPAFVYINVLDSNDNPPVFVPAEYNKRVSENVKPGDAVLQVTAVDQDTGTNAQFTFAITEGDDADMFAIRSDPKNSSIGIVKTLLQLDRETVPQYNLTITATDTGGLQGVAVVHITVTDYNDNGPWFIPRFYEGTIRVTSDTRLEQSITTVRAIDPDEASNGPPFSFSIHAIDPQTDANRFGVRADAKDPQTAASVFSVGPFTRTVPEWTLTIKGTDSGSPRNENFTFVYIEVIDDQNLNEPSDGTLTIIVNAYNGQFAGGVIGKAYYQDVDYQGDRNKYTMASQEYFKVNEATGDIEANENIPMGQYRFVIDVEEQKQRTGPNFPKTVTSTVTVIVQSVSKAAILQSVAVQILALRKPAFFVADYYFELRKVIVIIFGVKENDVLIFSIQRALSDRVPNADVFGLEIQLAVRSSGAFLDKSEVVRILVKEKQRLEDLKLKIGAIGIDVCAYEPQRVGKCSNKVEASSAFTVVSGDYGQLNADKTSAPSSSLTVVSMNITLKALFTSIIPPDVNCTTATPCLHGGTCHSAVPRGYICECELQYRGPECQSTTRTFKGNSYIWLEKLVAYERSSVSLQFMTDTANGLLLYQGPLFEGANNGLPDKMALMIVKGYAKLVITLGPHPNAPLELYMDKGNRLDDRKWHTIQVIRELKKVTLRIDRCSHSRIVEDNGRILEDRSSCEIVGEIWGSAIYLNGFGPLQIGGVENSLDDPDINFSGFKGCIREINDNGVMYDLLNPLKQVNTELGCRLNNPCPDCNGHGYCEPLWDTSICVCNLGFTGPNCNARAKANWYRSNSYTQYRVKQARRKRRETPSREIPPRVPAPVSMANEFYTHLGLQVRVSPNSSDVVIFLASNSLGTEFSRIDVKNHVLRYIFRLGDRMKILKIPQLNVTDDKYHTVIVKREGNRASLQIDYSGKVEGTTGGVHKLLNMGGGSFFTGGLPNVTEVRVVEAFVNSGGNAILRTADGNIISSGIGSGYAGFSSSGGTFMGSMITVNAFGRVAVSSAASESGAFVSRVRGVVGSDNKIFLGQGISSSRQTVLKMIRIGEGGTRVRVMTTRHSQDKKVIISSFSRGASGGSSGTGGTSGGGGGGGAGGVSGGSGSSGSGGVSGGSSSSGSGGVSGGSSSSGSGGVSGESGSTGIVTGATVLGGAASMGANGEVQSYGTTLAGWTLVGAGADDEKVEVIGDFGGCTAANSYNGVDLDSDPTIEARRQNVEFPCPCAENICLHGGTCVSAKVPYCICPPGWTGQYCGSVVKEPNPGTRGSRWANPAVIACILVIILAVFIIIAAVLLKRRPEPTVVAVVEDGHVHDNVRPYHDEGAGEEDNFGYDITALMKYTYVENGMAGTGGVGFGKFKNGGASSGEEEFTVAENKPLLQGAMPGAGLHHGVTTITKRRVVHPDSIDVKQFIDTRVHEADGEYILSIDELHIYRYEGDDSDVDDLSELGDSDEEPDEEEEQEFAFLQEWGKKFDNLNRIFNEED